MAIKPGYNDLDPIIRQDIENSKGLQTSSGVPLKPVLAPSGQLKNNGAKYTQVSYGSTSTAVRTNSGSGNMVMDSKGDIYFIYADSSTGAPNPGWKVVKYDRNLNRVWEKGFGSTQLKCLAIDDEDNVYVSYDNSPYTVVKLRGSDGVQLGSLNFSSSIMCMDYSDKRGAFICGTNVTGVSANVIQLKKDMTRGTDLQGQASTGYSARAIKAIPGSFDYLVQTYNNASGYYLYLFQGETPLTYSMQYTTASTIISIDYTPLHGGQILMCDSSGGWRLVLMSDYSINYTMVPNMTSGYYSVFDKAGNVLGTKFNSSGGFYTFGKYRPEISSAGISYARLWEKRERLPQGASYNYFEAYNIQQNQETGEVFIVGLAGGIVYLVKLEEYVSVIGHELG